MIIIFCSHFGCKVFERHSLLIMFRIFAFLLFSGIQALQFSEVLPIPQRENLSYCQIDGLKIITKTMIIKN